MIVLLFNYLFIGLFNHFSLGSGVTVTRLPLEQRDSRFESLLPSQDGQHRNAALNIHTLETPKLTESQGFGDDFIFPLGSTEYWNHTLGF